VICLSCFLLIRSHLVPCSLQPGGSQRWRWPAVARGVVRSAHPSPTLLRRLHLRSQRAFRFADSTDKSSKHSQRLRSPVRPWRSSLRAYLLPAVRPHQRPCLCLNSTRFQSKLQSFGVAEARELVVGGSATLRVGRCARRCLSHRRSFLVHPDAPLPLADRPSSSNSSSSSRQHRAAASLSASALLQPSLSPNATLLTVTHLRAPTPPTRRPTKRVPRRIRSCARPPLLDRFSDYARVTPALALGQGHFTS
jgi:hypothetical protein